MTNDLMTAGSSWHRWDPHLHLPGTVLNDQFNPMTMAEALDHLAAQDPPIVAIGVTDYCTTASFRRAAKARSDGAGNGISFTFPNVELRLDNATSRNHGVDIHLLCDPTDVDSLDEFLSGLEFSHAEVTYRCERQSLERLGRAFRGEPKLDDEAAFRVGVEQFKVNFEALRRTIRADKWARNSLLVAVAGGQGDGSSGLRNPEGSFTARRQSIESLADIVFSANPQQSEYWSGRGAAPVKELEHIYGGRKLCLHGSDAHTEDDLGSPQDDRFTWLKGAPAFDTLKLACVSPESRGHIGPISPSHGSEHGRIVQLNVPSTEWFIDERVPVNPGLVAIIGPRGSGKTALADLLAAGAGSGEPFSNGDSFVRRAGRLLLDTTVSVEWSHGEVTVCDIVNGAAGDEYLRPVRYLSQQFVDRLCASDGMSDELLEEIERVVFDAWPMDRRQGATTFRQLLETRLGSAKQRQASELGAVLDLSDQVNEVAMLKRALPERTKERKAKTKELSDAQRNVKDLTGKADAKSAARLAVVGDALQERSQVVQQLDRSVTALTALRDRVGTDRTTTFRGFFEKLRAQHEHAGLSSNEWDEFEVDFRGNVDQVLDNATERAQQKRAEVAGEPTDSGSGPSTLNGLSTQELRSRTVSDLKAEVARLQTLVGLDEKRAAQLKTLTGAAQEVQTRLAQLKEEIDRAEQADTAQLIERRLGHYRAYFEALLEEERQLRDLYEPLGALLDDGKATTSKLRLTVRRVVDIASWAAEGEQLLDHRREGPFRGLGAIAEVALRELAEPWESGTAEEAAGAIDAFATKYSDDVRRLRKSDDDAESQDEWRKQISRWIYRTSHISLRYSLEYDGLSIERLSPGMRGIVLLLLYLAVDREETDPLLIDQPEENLDPESVYSELVELFRTASARRQIIMVTHNANLVVNADVDQVIVAHCGALEEGRLPEFHYVSGGLESPTIRKAVCEVLEGGADAFKQRARRLGLDLSIAEDVEDR